VIATALILVALQAGPDGIGPSASPAGTQSGTPSIGGYSVGTGTFTPSVAAPSYSVPSPAASSYSVPGLAAPSYAIAPSVEAARTGVTIDAYDKRIESRWGSDDPFYTSTVRGGALIAQSRQGQLDGGWTLAGPDGAALYVLQLVDAGEGWLEGAWREGGEATGARPGASGFIGLISRESGRVVLRFLEPGAPAPTAVTLQMAPDGSWRGQAARGDAPGTPVQMVRR
jgi:hypothetical protein